MSRWKRVAAFAGPVLLALGVVVALLQGREAPIRPERSERITPARVVPVQRVAVVPRAEGFGYVVPDRVWEAVAQVSGRVVARHARLERGELLPAGTEILRLEATDYELALTETAARLAAARAEADQLARERENLQATRAIEDRMVVLAERELARKQALGARKAVSQATVDAQERAVLSQRQRVQDIDNALALMPARREKLDQDVNRLEAQLAAARLDLARTRIVVPFALRVAEVTVETGQFVSRGERLVSGDSVAAAEISAQLPIGAVRPLLATFPGEDITAALGAGGLPARAGLSAVVRLSASDFEAVWPAQVARFDDRVDPRTRTVGVVVSVADPYGKAVPGRRPPLVKNMYVAVGLAGSVQPDRLVIPRAAWRAGGVYVLDTDDRLRFRPLRVAYRQGAAVVIEDGLTVGERVVVSDLVPAIEGMRIAPQEDPALLAAVIRAVGPVESGP